MARAAIVLLALALSGCAGAGAAEPPDQPRRSADYAGPSKPAAAQCGRAVEERTGGWFCSENE